MTRWIRVQDSQDFVRSTSRFSSSPVQPSTAQLCLGITVVGAGHNPRGDIPELVLRSVFGTIGGAGSHRSKAVFGSISQKPIGSDPIGSDVAAGLGKQPRFEHVSSRHGKEAQSPSEETAS